MRAFLDNVDTPGGHILVCLFLIAMGAALWKLHIPKSEDVMVGAVGVLFGSMRGRGGVAPGAIK